MITHLRKERHSVSDLYGQAGYPKPYSKDALWSPSYFVSSVGGAPIEVLKQYIKSQEKPS
jgi:putative transposase